MTIESGLFILRQRKIHSCTQKMVMFHIDKTELKEHGRTMAIPRICRRRHCCSGVFFVWKRVFFCILSVKSKICAGRDLPLYLGYQITADGTETSERRNT